MKKRLLVWNMMYHERKTTELLTIEKFICWLFGKVNKTVNLKAASATGDFVGKGCHAK